MSWSRRPTISLMIATLFVALLLPRPALADGAWLENPALVWNEASMPIPKAPPLNPLEDPRCLEQLRPAESDAARMVEAAGWKLYIGDLTDGNVRIVRGLAGFDGMCRPLEYQAFAFTGGTPAQFIGTLSPTTMDSRTDGALIQIELVNMERVIGRYARYTDSDALCCPSAVTTVTFRTVPIGSTPVLSRVGTTTEPTSAAAPASSGSPASPGTAPAPAQVPVQVPRSR